MTARRVMIHRIPRHVLYDAQYGHPALEFYNHMQRNNNNPPPTFMGQRVLRTEIHMPSGDLLLEVEAPPPSLSERYNDMSEHYLGSRGAEQYVDGEGRPVDPQNVIEARIGGTYARATEYGGGGTVSHPQRDIPRVRGPEALQPPDLEGALRVAREAAIRAGRAFDSAAAADVARRYSSRAQKKGPTPASRSKHDKHTPHGALTRKRRNVD